MSKMRKTPLRKCVATQEMFPKDELIRVVRTKDGDVFVDETGKKNGRGAYISKSQEALKKAKEKNVFATHLNTRIEPTVYEQIHDILERDSL